MNLETVHFEGLIMSDKKPPETKTEPTTLGPQLLQALGSVPFDPADLPSPASDAWESLREEAAGLEEDNEAVAAQ